MNNVLEKKRMCDPLFDGESAFTIKLHRFYTFTVSCHNIRVALKNLFESILQAMYVWRVAGCIISFVRYICYIIALLV